MSKQEGFLSRVNTAKLLDVSPSTIDRWASAGKFNRHTIGSKVLFKRSELIEALKHHGS